jgi:ABC-type dipeptide/oligopeptide/nickel transport system permease component
VLGLLVRRLLWAAVLIVALSLLADLAIAGLDPRIRAGGRPL